jgi:hypothetical protein
MNIQELLESEEYKYINELASQLTKLDDKMLPRLVNICEKLGCMEKIGEFRFNMPKEWMHEPTKGNYAAQKRGGFLAIMITAINEKVEEELNNPIKDTLE